MFEEEEKADRLVNFHAIDAPCCGNCKWFEREYEDTWCNNPKHHCLGALEHWVCDNFERGEWVDESSL